MASPHPFRFWRFLWGIDDALSSSVKGEERKDENENQVVKTVSWQNLTVFVPSNGWQCCVPALQPFRTFGIEFLGMQMEQRDEFFPLKDISGYLSTGEVVLLIAPTGGGRSTLLRSLTSRLTSEEEIHGVIAYNGLPIGPSQTQKWKRILYKRDIFWGEYIIPMKKVNFLE